jgi:hypothetical protein
MSESMVIFSLIYLTTLSTCNSNVLLRSVQEKIDSQKYFLGQNYVSNNLISPVKTSDNHLLISQTHLSETHSLIKASEEDIKQLALQYTHRRFKVLSNVPRVFLVRRVTTQDLRRLNLDPPQFSREPPLAIVMIEGDFEVKLLGSRIPQRNKYLIYAFDLCAGVPAMTDASTSKRRFKEILNKGKLLPLILSPKTRSVNIASTQSCNTDSIAPPITLPPKTSLPPTP